MTTSSQTTSQNLYPPCFAGADVGASRTKVAVIDADGYMLGYCVDRSGTDFSATADRCLTEALAMADIKKDRIARTISTGYGRKNVSYAQDYRTEISCHGKGCFHYFPFAITIIDIGGQDNKIIKLDENGKRTSFKMNRKCAAGTGAFLEEMSPRLDIPLTEMNGLAAASTNMVKLGSFCTVFSATEVLENIRRGKRVEDIVKGLFFSVISRIREMDAFTEKVVMTGGVVAHNPYLVEMTQELISRPILVPDLPQFTGALGAALYARETFEN
ncbi:acyl-CoA dehydratase activase [uncultured Desulfosarcina sp.]|uniref:acyl-CoA dehydratase activase n=1 Tax=uncultured Desulfosarcina sp. TaxID=218289 RepID=UPI0029C637A0|nr:acyl-CoA dehydratase activase [uncultured Desulfosarcina sp.]